jgi:hypothetical protein
MNPEEIGNQLEAMSEMMFTMIADMLTDQDGSFTVELKDGRSVMVQIIPANAEGLT